MNKKLLIGTLCIIFLYSCDRSGLDIEIESEYGNTQNVIGEKSSGSSENGIAKEEFGFSVYESDAGINFNE